MNDTASGLSEAANMHNFAENAEDNGLAEAADADRLREVLRPAALPKRGSNWPWRSERRALKALTFLRSERSRLTFEFSGGRRPSAGMMG